MTSNTTVHISLGTSANHVTSHLLNLQGLAATSSSTSSGGSGGDTNDDVSASLCDASVTHDISQVDSDYSSSRSGNGYMYVPRSLVVDGRDSFGTAWGGVSCNSNHNNQQQHLTSSSTSVSQIGSSLDWSAKYSINLSLLYLFGKPDKSISGGNDSSISFLVLAEYLILSLSRL